MSGGDYYTLRGYDRMEKPEISAAMEDYLEMIARLVAEGKYARISQLAAQLNVTPPSASKMVGRLRESGLVDFEPYGIVQLTPEGERLGAYLLHRHRVLHRFFCAVNRSDNQLELVEKIEHFLDPQTVANMERWLERHPDYQPQVDGQTM